ncbi:MAG: hypothetical protein WA902_15525 [Thermosynechococcaceae cyanobacterium]
MMLQKLVEISSNLSDLKSDVTEIKISQARTEERLNSLETGLSEFKAETAERFSEIREDIKTVRTESTAQLGNLRDDIKATDNRLWTLIAGVVLALFGLLAKMAFFPVGQV